MKTKRYTLKRHYVFLVIFRFIFGPFFKLYYRFHAKKIKIKKQGPFLILANHTAEFDIIFTDMMFDVPLYFVASEQLLNSGFGSWFLRYFFNPIPKSKSMTDLAVVKRMVSVRNEGGNIAIFPEGNATMHGEPVTIPKGIGRLIKFLKMPVIFLNIHGLYLSAPRWAYFRKFGRSTIVENRRLLPSEYASLSDEDVDQIVYDALSVSAYKAPFKIGFKGKNRAEGLHKLIFTCPSCNTVFSMISTKHALHCQSCDYHAFYGEDGLIHEQHNMYTLKTMDDANKIRFVDYLRHHDEFSLEYGGMVSFWKAGEKRRSPMQPCTFKISRNEVTLTLKEKQFVYSIGSVLSAAIQVRTKLIVYLEEDLTLLLQFPRYHSPYAALMYLQYLLHQGGKHDEIHSNEQLATLLGL